MIKLNTKEQEEFVEMFNALYNNHQFSTCSNQKMLVDLEIGALRNIGYYKKDIKKLIRGH